jgi:hypothetical protein
MTKSDTHFLETALTLLIYTQQISIARKIKGAGEK